MTPNSLHGRETVVCHLSESITAVEAGQGCVSLVEGAAGLGKSRLLLEAATRARRLGIAVASARANELGRLSPLAPLLAALRSSVPPILEDTELANAQMLAYGRLELIEQLTALLKERARSQPILIVLDDLQWADPLTLLAVQSITERLAASSVMWLLSRRPWPSTPALDGVRSALVAGGATTIELEPLSTGTVAAVAADLLGAAPDSALLGLLEKCGGNPYMVVELLRMLDDQDELLVDTASARLLPGGPSGHLSNRLSRGLTSLSPQTRQLLEVASIFGRSFDLRCVAQVLHRTVADLLPSIHEVLGADLVVEEGELLAFRHDLIREATYSALPVSARRALHREAAAALLSIGGSAVEAAAHVTKGAGPRPQVESVRVGARSVTQRPAFGWGSLTEAELRVARLAAHGLTNRAIADELSLSPHTVESHLRHAFHKLDLRSRVELTRVVLTHEPEDLGPKIEVSGVT
jgi:predicted ATPase/DNA-binding CsgD family transcriptional regulator